MSKSGPDRQYKRLEDFEDPTEAELREEALLQVARGSDRYAVARRLGISQDQLVGWLLEVHRASFEGAEGPVFEDPRKNAALELMLAGHSVRSAAKELAQLNGEKASVFEKLVDSWLDDPLFHGELAKRTVDRREAIVTRMETGIKDAVKAVQLCVEVGLEGFSKHNRGKVDPRVMKEVINAARFLASNTDWFSNYKDLLRRLQEKQAAENPEVVEEVAEQVDDAMPPELVALMEQMGKNLEKTLQMPGLTDG